MLFIIILTLLPSCLANETVAEDAIFNPDSLFEPTQNSKLDFVDSGKLYGFDVENHYVTTRDGYILRVFRIVRKSFCDGVDLGPLAFLHGLFLSADTCILRGEDSHCYEYARQCYDVWAPNMRGNKYSRNHTTLNPDKDMAFWKYDFDEMALEDLSAILDYITKKTGKPVIIVAHSQGVTIVLILCAMRPEYNVKIRILFAMSTASWLKYSRVFVLLIEAVLAPGISIGSALGFHGEIIKHNGLLSKLAQLLCGLTSLSYPICSIFVFAFFGYNEYEITYDVLRDTVHKEPSGSSIDLFGRWGIVKSCGLTQRDYGYLKNILVYGTPYAPGYPFQNVKLEIIFVSSNNDYVCDPRDLARLRSNLTNCKKKTCHLDDQFYGHLDYVLGKSAKSYCVDLFTAYMRNGSTADCKGKIIEG